MPPPHSSPICIIMEPIYVNHLLIMTFEHGKPMKEALGDVLHLNQPLMFVGACHFKGSIGAWLVDAPMFRSIMVQFWYKWFCDPPTRNRLQNGSSEAGTMFCYFVANDFNSCPLLGSFIFSLRWVVIVCLEPFFIAQFNLCILLAWLRWYICLVCDTVITSTRWKNQVQTKVNIDCFLIIIDYSVMCLLLVTFFFITYCWWC